MRIPFKISEFCIENYAISQRVANSILHDHILEILEFRLSTGYPITAVEESGYRSKSYELRKGRSGASQHTFPARNGRTGAIDWSCINKRYNKKLLTYIINNTNYTRVAYKGDFKNPVSIHCDHKPTVDGKRQLFTYRGNKWLFIKNI